MADQLWLMKCIQEEEEVVTQRFVFGLCNYVAVVLQLCVVYHVSEQLNLSPANQNLVTVHMKPDETGRFGFNVKV